MTTIYTELTEHGITFEDFVMDCVGVFGALVEIQDDLAERPERAKDSPKRGGVEYVGEE